MTRAGVDVEEACVHTFHDKRVVPHHAHGTTGDVGKQSASIVNHLNRATMHWTMRIMHDAAAGRKAQRLMSKADAEKRRRFAVQRQFCQPHRQTCFFWPAGPGTEQQVAWSCVEKGSRDLLNVAWAVRSTPLHDVHVVPELHDGVSDVVGERIQVVHQHHGSVRPVPSLSKAAAEGGAMRNVQWRDSKPSSCAGSG